MTSRRFLSTALILLSLSLIQGCVPEATGNDGEPPGKPAPLILAYCPTMEPIAQEIAKENERIELMRKGSTLDVIASLEKQETDIALVGRIAKAHETQADHRLLGSGHTLVSKQKKFMQRHDLDTIIVHTSVAPEAAEALLPETEITYHPTLEEALKAGLKGTVLIDWRDFRDDMELVVIMEGDNKATEFRLPVLYSHAFDLASLENI